MTQPYSLKTLPKLRSKLVRAGKRIVFTNGCFDLLHAGHVDYLARARKYGDVLVVGLNSDRSVRSIKGPGRPLTPERDRAKVLSALSSVTYVALFHEDTPAKLIQVLKPHVLVKGSDWRRRDIAGRKEVLSWGGRVRRIPLLKGRSTTRMIQKIKKRG